ncbi:MAG: bifunctional oligoribonuclease/PAP phosphatase NrnA [Ndongobacter sp.]|nr:bifunctional oligoribonuclease/PAP phosphatase NrnA [Ndongobacter sp.]
MNSTSAMAELLRKSETIAVAGHLNPDGDCLGAVLGLGVTLRAMGKQVDMLQTDPVPLHLSYLPHLQDMKPVDPEKAYDLFVLLDLGDVPRMGAAHMAMENSASSLCIDHHQTNGLICDQNWVRPDASSTCEMVAELLLHEGFSVPSDAATALYAGLITDSNRFLYDTARARAMRIGAELIDAGADVDLVYYHEFQTINANLFAFQGYQVEHAEYLANGRIVLANATQKLLAKYKLEMPEAESAVDVLKNMDGVEIAVLVKDIAPGTQKISLRSKRYFDVSEIACRFGGGGHKKAAGCTLSMSNEQALRTIREALLDIDWSAK